MTAVSWSMLCEIGAMMPNCIKTLMRSIGLRSMRVARSRTVIESPTTTCAGAAAVRVRSRRQHRSWL